MSIAAFRIIDEAMAFLGLAYEFGTYTGTKKYPYFVGSYTETEGVTEDGLQESAFLLTGFSRDSWATLEQAKEAIENYFYRNSGRPFLTKEGFAVVVMYAGSLVIPTGDAELKSIQINLRIKEWKVN